ncbi:MAG: hypothetical protein AAF449_09230 [Myxococcota bacterium]
MTTVWISTAFAAFIWLLTLRLSVRLVDRGIDNGWDNAIGYAIVSALALSAVWSTLAGPWLVILGPFVLWAVQTGAIMFIYEVRPLTALGLGLLHLALFSTAATVSTVVAGAIAIYLLYGKIVSDPLVILRSILRWLGFDWPF